MKALPPLAPLPLHASEVLRVIDGDTLEVSIDLGLRVKLHHQRVRLTGIDAPELGLPGRPGETSRKVLERLLAVSKNQVILLTSHARKDQYGRWLAVVFAADKRGFQFNVNTWMRARGFAKAGRVKEEAS